MEWAKILLRCRNFYATKGLFTKFLSIHLHDRIKRATAYRWIDLAKELTIEGLALDEGLSQNEKAPVDEKLEAKKTVPAEPPEKAENSAKGRILKWFESSEDRRSQVDKVKALRSRLGKDDSALFEAEALVRKLYKDLNGKEWSKKVKEMCTSLSSQKPKA